MRVALPSDITIELHTWTLDVDDAERARLLPLLSTDEQERARRFHFDLDRQHHIVARGRMRQLLGARVGTAPERLTFRYAEHGKPELSGPGIQPFFNLSHSGGLAALALTDACELGLDVEAVRPARDLLAERFFSVAEVTALRALPASEEWPAFHRCWTRKEAVLKALGSGLSRRLDSFDVTLTMDEPARLLRMEGEPDAPRTWTLLNLLPAPGFAGALALRAHGRPVTLVQHGA